MRLPLNLPYYYGHTGEQYAFFRIPKLLITDSRFDGISSDAKLLYGLLLDRMELSYRNGWIDEQNRVFIIFTVEEVMTIVDRTNALRRAKGVAALRVNDKLTQAAQVRADEIAASGVYSHTRPDGRKSNTVTDSKYTGENLHNISELYLEQQHKTLSEAVVELWSNSKAHADNMTSARYGEIGVGLARGIDKDGFDCWYCVQVFLLDGCEVTRVDTPANK